MFALPLLVQARAASPVRAMQRNEFWHIGEKGTPWHFWEYKSRLTWWEPKKSLCQKNMKFAETPSVLTAFVKEARKFINAFVKSKQEALRPRPSHFKVWGRKKQHESPQRESQTNTISTPSSSTVSATDLAAYRRASARAGTSRPFIILL